MPAIDRVAVVTIAVKDQDAALQWFTEKLGYEKRADIPGAGMRWLTVAPRKQKEVAFLLASWFPNLIGKNATCVVETQDCHQAYAELKKNGVRFTQEPASRPYGLEAVFEDLYGNHYALLQRSA
ncbi:MAG TPA: VOC family protein [Candidatus Angelobacter sp.]|jgi:predicted enzyme related to lactoylglutathione lyase